MQVSASTRSTADLSRWHTPLLPFLAIVVVALMHGWSMAQETESIKQILCRATVGSNWRGINRQQHLLITAEYENGRSIDVTRSCEIGNRQPGRVPIERRFRGGYRRW